MDLINFSTGKRVQLKELSALDHIMHALRQMVCNGWPDTIKEVPQDLRPYWSYRDEIGISYGVIFKGRQVTIPDGLGQDILQHLHEAHLGIEKTRRRMREYTNHKNIETMVKSCPTCQENHTERRQQSLVAHDGPSTPWTKVASDMFEIKGDNYLIITDYQSKFHVVQIQHPGPAT